MGVDVLHAIDCHQNYENVLVMFECLDLDWEYPGKKDLTSLAAIAPDSWPYCVSDFPECNDGTLYELNSSLSSKGIFLKIAFVERMHNIFPDGLPFCVWKLF